MDVNNTSSYLSSATGKLAPLAERIMKRADVNRDGNVTSGEFSDFLTKLSASLEAALAAAARQHKTSAPAAPAPAPAAPLPSGTISASKAAIMRLVADNLPTDR
ncbi:MAG: EF-hand domain-containing protein [Ardenticatenales bacterium]